MLTFRGNIAVKWHFELPLIKNTRPEKQDGEMKLYHKDKGVKINRLENMKSTNLTTRHEQETYLSANLPE